MPGVTITAPLPEVGVTVGPTWASLLIAWCNEVEADIEGTISLSSITVDRDLEFNNYKAIELNGAQFQSKTAADASSGVTSANMLEVVGGDLHFIDGNGTSIKLTSGGAINLSTSGGFTGDYISSDAECDYSTSNNLYTFIDDSAAPAKINCGQIQLRHETAGSNAIIIQSPAALASGYNWVLPTTVGTNTKTEWIVGYTSGSTVTLDTGTTLSDTANFTDGARFKLTSAGVGSDPLKFYQHKGTFGTLGGTVSTLGWEPVITHAGLALESSDVITYITRYAWLQKIDDWVTLFARIEFYVTWTGGASECAEAPIFITGAPYTAWTGVGTGAVTQAITAYGEVYEFPRNDHMSTTPGLEMAISASDYAAANDSKLTCYMLENETTIRFFPTAINAVTATYGSGRMPGVAFDATGWGPSHASASGGSRAAVKLAKATVGGSPPATVNKCYTIAFKIQYRAL